MAPKPRPRLLGLLLLVFAKLTYCQSDAPTLRAIADTISAHQYSEALRLVEPLLKAHSTDASLWTLQALALDGLGRTEDSLASFNRALAIAPTFTPALQGAAQTAYRRGDPNALQYVEKLLAVMPTSDVANAMAGALTYLAHDCSNSILYFKRSKDQVYRDPKALDELADCLLKEQQVDEALAVLSKGVQQHPLRTDLQYNLAVAQMRAHRPAEAVKTLAPLSNTIDSELLNLLASAYIQVNQPDDAFRLLERAIEINPKEQSNYLDLAILCLEHNQEHRSVAASTAGIGRIPRAASLYLIRGVAYAQLAEYDKAESDFVSASQVEPDQPHSTIAMSMLYSDRNEVEKEEALLTKQLKATPNDGATNYLLADLLVRSGAVPGQPRFAEAKAHLAVSLAARPDSAEAQILMGKLLEQENNLPEALAHYELGLKSEPADRGALNRKFVLLRKLHRNDEALQVLTQLKSVLNGELKQEIGASPVRVLQPVPTPQ